MEQSTATRVARLEITDGILYALSTILICLRLYTRTRIVKTMGAGDWCMLVVWGLSTIQLALWTVFNHFGNAQHLWNMKPENLSNYFLVCWIIQWEYPLSLGVVKISVLLLYHQLLPSDSFRLLIILVTGFVATMTTAIVFAFAFQCTPVEGYWTIALWTTKKCLNGAALSMASSALSCTTDLVILVLPIKYLLALRISTREKVQLILLFSLGGVTCIASVMRFNAIKKVYHSTDPTWDGFDLTFWTAVEYYLAIITACIPTIKPLWVKGIRKILAMIKGKNTSTNEESIEAPRLKFEGEPDFNEPPLGTPRFEFEHEPDFNV